MNPRSNTHFPTNKPRNPPISKYRVTHKDETYLNLFISLMKCIQLKYIIQGIRLNSTVSLLSLKKKNYILQIFLTKN